MQDPEIVAVNEEYHSLNTNYFLQFYFNSLIEYLVYKQLLFKKFIGTVG